MMEGTVEALTGGGRGGQEGVIRHPQSLVPLCGHIAKGLRELREREEKPRSGDQFSCSFVKTLL